MVIYHRDRIPDRPDSDTAVQADGLVGMPDGCIVKERKCSPNRYEAFPCQHASYFGSATGIPADFMFTYEKGRKALQMG